MAVLVLVQGQRIAILTPAVAEAGARAPVVVALQRDKERQTTHTHIYMHSPDILTKTVLRMHGL